MAGLVKLTADLKALRRAPGQMGEVKTIRVGTELAYLDESWSDLGFDVGSKFSKFLSLLVSSLFLCVRSFFNIRPLLTYVLSFYT